MTTKLSSGTWLVKGVFPVVGILFLVVFVLALFGIVPSNGGQGGLIGALAGLLVFNVFVFYFASKTKDVWVDKDHLIIKGGNKKERIDLADVARVTSWPLGNYRPVWVTFSAPNAFGRSIVFFDGYYFINIGRNVAAGNLRKMVARRKTARRKANQRVQTGAAFENAGDVDGTR
jgi:hypothetical protein